MGNGGAADFNQRPSGAERERMQQLHTDLFTRTTFPLDKYRHISFGYPFYLVTDSLHGSGFAEENIHRRQIGRQSGLNVMNQGYFSRLRTSRQSKAEGAILFTLHVELQSR